MKFLRGSELHNRNLVGWTTAFAILPRISRPLVVHGAMIHLENDDS